MEANNQTPTVNSTNAALLTEYEINIDNPLTPIEVATRRTSRLAKERIEYTLQKQQQQLKARVLRHQRQKRQQTVQDEQTQQQTEQATANSVASQNQEVDARFEEEEDSNDNLTLEEIESLL